MKQVKKSYLKKDISPAKVVTLSADKKMVTTIGGLRIKPEIHQLILNLTTQYIDKNIIDGSLITPTALD